MVLPPSSPSPRYDRTETLPWLALTLAGAATLTFLGLLIPLGNAERPAFTHGNLVLLPMTVALAVGVACWRRVQVWALGRDWGDRHLLALASGGARRPHDRLLADAAHHRGTSQP